MPTTVGIFLRKREIYLLVINYHPFLSKYVFQATVYNMTKLYILLRVITKKVTKNFDATYNTKIMSSHLKDLEFTKDSTTCCQVRVSPTFVFEGLRCPHTRLNNLFIVSP